MVDPWYDDVSKRWAVGCGRCGASSGRSVHAEGSKEAAIKSWNTRGILDAAQSIPGRALTASETSLIEKALRDSGEVVGVLEPVTPAQAAPKSALCADCIACGCKKDCTPRPPGIAYAPPEKAIEFLEWLIGFTGAVRTHPLNAYGNKILRDKLEQVGAELGIFSEPSSVPSTHQSPPVFKAAQSAESDPVVRPDCTGGDTAVPSTERSS
jgi:hypothetical protein